MFQFGGFAFQFALEYPNPDKSEPGWVAPFGYPRINASLQLPAAFRSLARPSSPLYAKASTVCPYVAFTCMACTTRRLPPSQTIAHELDILLPRSKIAACRHKSATAHTQLSIFLLSTLRQRTFPPDGENQKTAGASKPAAAHLNSFLSKSPPALSVYTICCHIPWSYGDSNPGPPACKAGALAS